MAAGDVKRTLVVTADTSGLKKGAADVEDFASSVKKTGEAAKKSSQEVASGADKLAAAWARSREGAAGLAGSYSKITAGIEQDMRVMAKAVSADLSAFSKDWSRVQSEQIKATEAIQRRALGETKAAEALRRTYDTAYAGSAKFLEVEQRVARQVELRNLTVEQGNAILAGAAARFKQMGDSIQPANNNIKLTSNQMQGLGYQLNDVGTMLAMGASPFQVMASQAGQVIQVLGDGPRGIGGSLAAIGSGIASFARAIPGAAYAVAGVAAGVAALWYATKGPDARSAEESLKSFEEAVKRLEDGWKGAGDAAKQHFEAAKQQGGTNQGAALLDIGARLKALREDYTATARALNSDSGISENIIRVIGGHISEARQQITDLYTDFRKGGTGAQELANKMLAIRLDPSADKGARILAEELRQALGPAIALEQQISALNNSIAKLRAPKGTMGRHDLPDDYFKDRFGPIIGGGGRFGDSDGMDAIRDGLKQQRDELTKTEPKVRTYADAVAEQRTALAGSVAELRLQVDMFGQSEGALAAAKFRMDAMADAQRQANDAKQGAIDPDLVDQINREAAEYGRLTDQIATNTKAQQERLRVQQEASQQQERLRKFEADMLFERSILTLPQGEQQIAQTLRGLNLEINSAAGQRIADGLRFNDVLRKQQEALQTTSGFAQNMGDVFADVFSSAIRDGENFFDSMVRGFSAAEGEIDNSGTLFERIAA